MTEEKSEKNEIYDEGRNLIRLRERKKERRRRAVVVLVDLVLLYAL